MGTLSLPSPLTGKEQGGGEMLSLYTCLTKKYNGYQSRSE
jgi:hypothetical protein